MAAAVAMGLAKMRSHSEKSTLEVMAAAVFAPVLIYRGIRPPMFGHDDLAGKKGQRILARMASERAKMPLRGRRQG